MHGMRAHRHGDPLYDAFSCWTEEMDAALLTCSITRHDQRAYGKAPGGLADVAKKFNKTYQAAVDRYHHLRQARGLRGLWTQAGLWTEAEDDVIRNHMPAPGERVPLGTWPEVALHLGRTAASVRTRACYLRRADREAKGGVSK